MASNTLNVRIQQKYDTEANWVSKDPVLLSGEMAISSDKNGMFKTGNGSSKWSQLIYNQVPWTSVTGKPILHNTIDADFVTKYRTETKGAATSGDYISTIRNNLADVENAPQHGTGLAFGRGDTHGYFYMDFRSPKAYIGAGNADKLIWTKEVSLAGHTHSYLPLSGGTLTGPLKNSYVTNTYLAGNQGNALLSSTAVAGKFVAFLRYPSTNGYFTFNGYENKLILGYTAKTVVDANTNGLTHRVFLLDETGDTTFPGTVNAAKFVGTIAANKVTEDSAHRFLTDYCKSISDWNAAITNGFYMSSSALNAPTSNTWYFGRVIAHNDKYLYQEVYQFTASTDAKAIPKYIRCKRDGTWGSWTNVTVAKSVPADAIFTDTKNTTGSLDSSSKLFLIGATSQATNPVTYSHDTAYIGTDGCLYSQSKKVSVDGHTHSYLPLSGGTMTGNIIFNKNTTGISWSMNTDGAFIGFKNDADSDSDSYLLFQTADNNNEYFKWQHKNSDGVTEWMNLRQDGLRVKGTKVSLEGHNHTKAQITDFPTSMPASDVYAWAKAATKPSYTWNEIGNKPTTFPPSTHEHTNLVSIYTSPNSSASNSGKYFKIASIKISERYGFCNYNYKCVIGGHGSAKTGFWNFGIWIKQQNEFGANPYMEISLHKDDTSKPNYANFYLQVDELNANYTQVSLYGQINTTHTILRLFVEGYYSSQCTLTYANPTIIDTLPTTVYKVQSVDTTNAHSHNYLPLTGGVMTGNVSYNMYSTSRIPLEIYGGNSDGLGMTIGAGAATIIGGGESAQACKSLLSATNEQLWLTSDTAIYFYTNCQTIGNKAGVLLDTQRIFRPDTNGVGSIGSSSYKWNTMYANTFNGALSGNSTTATKWQTARNVNGMSIQGDANRVNYGVCSTAGNVNEKVVACAGFTLITGAEITIKFTVANTTASPTLNVNGTGAKPIYYRGAAIAASYLGVNRTYTFRYNGTQYEFVGDVNTNNTNTAGSTNSSSKLFIIGAPTQATSPVTYSHDTAYIGTDGCLYSNNTKVSVEGHTHRKYCIVGSDTENTAGWYKVASQTMSGYDDTNITFVVTSAYGNYYTGIFQLQMRSENTSVICKIAKWLTRIGFPSNCIRIVVSNMTWTMYIQQTLSQYRGIIFEVISDSRRDKIIPAYSLFNTTTKETVDPVATVTSSDGATVNYANNAGTSTKLSTARKIGNVNFDGTSNITLKQMGVCGEVVIKNITIATSSFSNLVANYSNASITANQVPDVMFSKASQAVAAKAGISVSTEAGKLVLTALRLPESNLTIESLILKDVG